MVTKKGDNYFSSSSRCIHAFGKREECERNSDWDCPVDVTARRNAAVARASVRAQTSSYENAVRFRCGPLVDELPRFLPPAPTGGRYTRRSLQQAAHPSIILPLALTRDGPWKARVALWDLLLPSSRGVICFDGANSVGASQPSDRPNDRTNIRRKASIRTEREIQFPQLSTNYLFTVFCCPISFSSLRTILCTI